ncbi:MAG: protein kinase [Anaerolineae bacterium]|nr:protein kinase [Anaerolineae bacterium]
MSDPLIGKKLGDYLIQRLLGKGGMARVYVGYDDRLQRHAAVKVINSDLMSADRGEYAERFRREARAIARLNHPNIVSVYQFGEYEQLYYMAMAFIEGRDVRQMLREHGERGTRMPFREVLNIVQGIGSALDYAHSRGVIHRDIKPSNIMVDQDNRPILTDFGLALAAWEGTLGDTFGTAHYIAPEQAMSSAKAVPQSDLYSLGICTYEMLTGRVPFDDPSAMSVALKHLNEPPPPLRTIVPTMPIEVEAVILKVLEKDPLNRFTTGAEMSEMLDIAMSSTITDSRPSRRTLPFDDPRLSDSQVRRILPTDSAIGANPPSSPQKPPLRLPIASSATPDVASSPNRSVPPLADHASGGHPPTLPASTQPSVPKPIPDLFVAAPASAGQGRAASRWLIPVAAAVAVALLLLIVVSALSGRSGGEGTTPTAALIAASGSPEPSETSTLATAESASATPEITLEARALETLSEQTRIALLAGGTTAPVQVSQTPQAETPAAATVEPSPTIPDTVAPSPEPVTVTVSVDPVTSTDTPEPVSTVPTLTITPSMTASATTGASSSPKVLLVYDRNQLNLVNQSVTAINITQLVFRQSGPSRVYREFAASRWDRPFAEYPPSAVPPGICFQVGRLDRGRYEPFRECRSLSAYVLTSDSGWFWIAVNNQVTVFEVYLNDQKLSECPINEGRCEVSIP